METSVGDFSYDYILGLTLEEANLLLKREGVACRVVTSDGKPMLITADYHPNRLNLSLIHGRVVSYTHG